MAGDFMLGDTIAAVSTPRGKGGVALIRISGDAAKACLEKCFIPISHKGFAARCAVYGKIVNAGEIIDYGIAVFFEGGHSYTGEPTAEITCHGGIAVTEAVLEAVLTCGARAAHPGEFTKRAFINGRLSLTEAEAIGRLIDADTDSRRRLAAGAAHEGKLAEKTKAITAALTGVLSALYAAIDYPDEDIGTEGEEQLCNVIMQAAKEAEALLGTYKIGSAIADGVKTVICGVPNSGKSSLYNKLCGEDRAIVTSIAGTTRDTLEETVDIGGVTLRLADTAGLREAGDEAEKAGIERALGKIKNAELIIFVTDGSAPLEARENELLLEIKNENAAKIAVVNKVDIKGVATRQLPSDIFDKTVFISALTGEGIDSLILAIRELWGAQKLSITDDAIIWNARQKAAISSALDLLNAAKDALILGDPTDAVCTMVEGALTALSELDGRNICEEITNQIFSKFCVGK